MHAHFVESIHAGMPNLGECGGMPPSKFVLSEIESESIFNDLHNTMH